VGDVRKRAAVDEGRPTFERLEQIRLDRIQQKDGHRAGALEVCGGDSPAVERGRDDHPGQSSTQVVDVRGERQHGHDFAGNGDLPISLARVAVLAPAQAHDGTAQRPIRDVDHARPEHAQGIDVERIVVGERVVDEGGEQVVSRTDGVVVASEVEVEVLHRDNLAVAPAGRAALDAEDGAQGRLANADGRPVADPVEPLY
jgi:hypothetical protein